MATQTVLTVDLGAESGRVMAVHFNGRSLDLQELHRFPNTTVTVNGSLHWNFLRLWSDIQTGIEAGKALNPASMGVDTWGVDFGLLDAQGHLIGNPVHYRDGRTDGMMDRVFEIVPREEVFAQTGIQFMPINTLYQMMSLVEANSPQLDIAHTFLTAPDLLNYWLTGAKVCEFSNATTTQMFNPRTGNWANDMLDKLSIPSHILPEIVQPGTKLGSYDGILVIAPACHDTGSAVASVPAQGEPFAYLSSGTWSLIGQELTQPMLSEAALAANVTNEGGVYGTYRLLKNVMGLWLVQQSRATWQANGRFHSYADLVKLAAATPPLQSLINVNDLAFIAPGDMPSRVQAFCQRTKQPVPQSEGEIIRTILESLALAYHDFLAQIMAVSQQPVNTIHIVGGGTQNKLLNQMTADATGLPVHTGPIEATVIGNALVQFISLGEIGDLAEARQLVAEMEGMEVYEPDEMQTAVWRSAYQKYKELK